MLGLNPALILVVGASNQGFVFQHPISDMNCEEIEANVKRWEQQGYSLAAEALREEAQQEKGCYSKNNADK